MCDCKTTFLGRISSGKKITAAIQRSHFHRCTFKKKGTRKRLVNFRRFQQQTHEFPDGVFILGFVPGDNRRYFEHCCEFTSTVSRPGTLRSPAELESIVTIVTIVAIRKFSGWMTPRKSMHWRSVNPSPFSRRRHHMRCALS